MDKKVVTLRILRRVRIVQVAKATVVVATVRSNWIIMVTARRTNKSTIDFESEFRKISFLYLVRFRFTYNNLVKSADEQIRISRLDYNKN